MGNDEVLWSSGTGVYPEWSTWVCTEERAEKCLARGEIPAPPRPKDGTLPKVFEELSKGKCHNHYVLRWPRPVQFDDGVTRQSMMYSVSKLGDAEAKRRAWACFPSKL